MDNVFIKKAAEYNPAQLSAAVDDAFTCLGIDIKSFAGKRILIKPNLLMKRKPEEATTTHPEVVRAIIKALKAAGADNITIADSPGGPYAKQYLSMIYNDAGYTKLAAEENVSLNFDTGFERFPCTDGETCKSFNIIGPIINADVVINVAKLKTHAMTGLSGAVKNLFGAVPGLQKPEMHLQYPHISDFCNMLVDLCLTVRPTICFVDAIVSMEGDGPSGGTPKSTGLLFASANPYALDRVLCKTINLDESSVYTVVHSLRRGLCAEKFSDIKLCGDALTVFDDFRMPASHNVNMFEKLPKPITAVMKRIFEKKPKITCKKCVGCGKCAESCPAHTIAMENRKAKIAYKKCIKCFCCHEMCPVKAIEIK